MLRIKFHALQEQPLHLDPISRLNPPRFGPPSVGVICKFKERDRRVKTESMLRKEIYCCDEWAILDHKF